MPRKLLCWSIARPTKTTLEQFIILLGGNGRSSYYNADVIDMVSFVFVF